MTRFVDCAAFFVDVCTNGFERACIEKGIDHNKGKKIIKRIELFFGFKLFQSCEFLGSNLTEHGLMFLDHAQMILVELSKIQKTKVWNQSDIFFINTDPLTGKNLLLPYIQSANIGKHICVTTEEYNNNESITHAIFSDFNDSEDNIYDKRWQLRLDQNLYASLNYLAEVRPINSFEDLEKQSILGYGVSFDSEIYKRNNWHLSGMYIPRVIEPSILLNSKSVLVAAIKTDLGIGPIANYGKGFIGNNLKKILPEINGPSINITYAINKTLNKCLRQQAYKVEKLLLDIIKSRDLKVYY